jgi:hypothetical protein
MKLENFMHYYYYYYYRYLLCLLSRCLAMGLCFTLLLYNKKNYLLS